MTYTVGDWIKYRVPRGWTEDGKILEKRPDGHLVVGSHENDPEPNIVDPDDVTGEIR